MQIVSLVHEMSKPIFQKNKNIFNLSSFEFVQEMVKIECLVFIQIFIKVGQRLITAHNFCNNKTLFYHSNERQTNLFLVSDSEHCLAIQTL